MNTGAKSTSILVATLAIGVVLGMVGQGLLLRSRRPPPDDGRPPPGFAAHMEDVIQPRPDQVRALRVILDSTALSNQRVIDSARGRLHLALDSLRLRLAPMLDDAQRDRLAQMSRLPDPFRPPRRRGDGPRDGRGGPPGGGPPGGGPPGGGP